MSLSKKRHIQESNRILEQRLLSESTGDPAVIEFAKNLITDDSTQELKNLKSTPNITNKKDQMTLLKFVSHWCGTVGDKDTYQYLVPQKYQTITVDSICKKAMEQSSSEKPGPGGLFGFRYS